ncbi:MAG: calcium/sodium antiporter [Myxococcota bacterium]
MSYEPLLLVPGLASLLVGGDVVVRGASTLARTLGISPLVVGLTVVAFGTSMPELAVNLTATWEGNSSLAFGNIVGSNLANIGLVVGMTALLRPIPLDRTIVIRELPMMLLATSAAWVMGSDFVAGRLPASYDRADGILLLLFFTVFLYYTVREVHRQRVNHLLAGTESYTHEERGGSVNRSLMLIGAGLAGLVLGSEWTVKGGVALARGLAVPEEVIGLSVVAIGTSLPELAAGLVASARGHMDLAVGNVVGSNVFNLLVVLGACSLVHPVPVPPGGAGDLLVLAVFSGLLMVVALSYSRRILRIEGAGLLLLYLGYLTTRTLLS